MSGERNRVGFVRVLAVCVVAITALARAAHADNVDQLIDQLDDSSDRVRISAVLSLTRQADPRAIDGLARRLDYKIESVKNIRGLAAKALAAIVTDKVKGRARQTAIDALTKAQSSDPDDFVKANADRALGQIGAGAPVSPPTGAKGGIYVNLGPMSARTGPKSTVGPDDPKYRALMQKTAETTMTRSAPAMQITWSGGPPTRAQLDKKGVAGFYVDGTLNEVKVDITGSSSKVSCKVSMLLASFPEKSAFGFLSGGAGVQASSSTKDIALAQSDCVNAVVEDLIAKKIIPTIKSKVSP
jgi:hypothetical protein